MSLLTKGPLNPSMARMTEAAGFAAIEIEDQLVPKRAHHHIGIEHMIPLELMAAKVKEARDGGEVTP